MKSPHDCGHFRNTVTFVVLTHNRVAEVIRTVECILAYSGSIIVVDNGSCDGTCEVLRATYPSVTVIRSEENIGAAARNIGIRRATSPYVALADDDTLWDSEAVVRAQYYMERHPAVAVVCGRVLVGREGREDPTSQLMAKSPLQSLPGYPGKAIIGFMAGASMIRRSAFLDVGGFDPRLVLGGEESLVAVDLAARGWQLIYADDVCIHHYPSPRRDLQGRRHMLFRNHLWFCWLRRSRFVVYRETASAIRFSLRNPEFLPTLLNAFRGLSWILAERKELPDKIEKDLLLLEEMPS
jgi:GT2 family glycosyltransferase